MTKPGPLCHLCPLKDAPGPVWGVGPASTKLALIGMAPEHNEVEQDTPFVGQAGVTLNTAFTRVGLQRSQLFVTNVVKCLVKAGSPLPVKAVECCAPLLDKELEQLAECKTYVTLGAPPFEAFTGKKLKTVTDRKDPKAWLRGCVYTISRSQQKVIIPTIHPAYLNYTGQRDRLLLQADLEKAKRFSEGGGVSVEVKTNYNPTAADMQAYVAECIRLRVAGLDIETPDKAWQDEEELVGTGVGQISVIGLSCRPGEAIGVPPEHFHLLQLLMEDKHVSLFVFNALFDIYHLRPHFSIKAQVIDVLLALHELHSDLQQKNLGVALSLYTDMPYTKNLAKIDPELYNASDTYGVLWAGQRMLERMKELDVYQHFLQQTSICLPVVEQLRLQGPRADVEKAARFEYLCSRALQKYQEAWDKLLPGVLWSSNDQLKALFQAQKLPIVYKMRKDKKTGKRTKTVTVDEGVLETYRDKHKSQTAGLILMMRKLKKAEDFCHLHQEDGRIHATYGLHFQRQGRIQTRNPDLQNTPEGLVVTGRDEQGAELYLVRPREIVVGDTDSDLVIVADFAQIELRLFAKQAEERGLLDEIEKGTYVYGITYEAIYKKSFFQVGKPKEKRFRAPYVTPKELLVAKTGPLGWIYGREDYTQTGMSEVESKAFGFLMHQTYPAISEFQRQIDKQAHRDGYLRNPFGRIRPVANPAIMRNEYLSFLGQGTAVDVLIKNALLPLHQGLSQFGERCRLIFTVYDSVGVNCPRDTAPDCVKFIRSCMEAPLEELDGFIIPCEIKVGRSWGEAVPVG